MGKTSPCAGALLWRMGKDSSRAGPRRTAVVPSFTFCLLPTRPMGNLGATEIILILLVVLLLFGAKRIPEIARGLGKGIREFKDATNDIKRELTVADQPHAQPQIPPPHAATPYVPPAPVATGAAATPVAATATDVPPASAPPSEIPPA